MNAQLTYQEQGKKNTVTFRVESAILHELMLDIGIPPNIYGYNYIIYALELILMNPNYIHSVTKGLYIDIAKRFNVNPSRVERSIRTAINIAWLHGNVEFINEVFKHCVRSDKGVPTNSVFLARLYYYIVNREYEWEKDRFIPVLLSYQ